MASNQIPAFEAEGVKGTMTADRKRLHLEIDLTHEGRVSGSGKSILVASTGGGVQVAGASGTVKVALNVYKPNLA